MSTSKKDPRPMKIKQTGIVIEKGHVNYDSSENPDLVIEIQVDCFSLKEAEELRDDLTAVLTKVKELKS